MKLRLATVNTLFDGVSIHDLSASKWIQLHRQAFMGDYSLMDKLRQEREGAHPVEEIVDQFQPHLIVVNEVIKSDFPSESIRILKSSGYKNFRSDLSEEISSGHKRGTLVACLADCDEVEVKVQRFPGGRFAALRVPAWQLVLIGVQGTPFNKFLRKKQVNTILEYFKKYQSNNDHVIVAGDFNMGINSSDLVLPDELQHFTRKTFPSPDFHEIVKSDNSIWSTLMMNLLKLRNGPRSLDHILFSQGMQKVDGKAVQTTSDHSALYLELEI